MQITFNSKQGLRILYFLSWIIFIGLCIEAGAFICNTVFTMVLNPNDARHLWQQADLSDLYKYDHGHFLAVGLFISITAILKAIMFYLVVKILHDKKLDMSQPFNVEVGRFIRNMSMLALGIGLFCWWGTKYSAWLITQGAKLPDFHYLNLGGADVWLFMGITLIVIAQIFKRGIEIQSENELTV